MGAQTEIQWCDSTFNPWIGCTKISPGCDHCYAERDMDTRRHVAKWGSGNPRKRTSPANWKLPLRWNRADFRACGECSWRGEIDTLESDQCPICGRHERINPVHRRVFCASLADVFDNEVDPLWRADLFHLIGETPNLDWLVLTKRIGNAEAMMAATLIDPAKYLDRLWLGATVVNHAEAVRDIPKLLATPARIRFLSCEPMLGAICPWADDVAAQVDPDGPGIDWVIAGGESGPKARPMHSDWVRALRDFCAAARTPFLFKQWGEWSEPGWSIPDAPPRIAVRDEAARWKIGKKAAGRSLDGRTHDGFPIT